ncbi:MAG: group III truncated hemoglobin [Sulfurovum sp.]|nr:group III truncated hemoglobin [Sulfurovum sp.]
MFETREQNITPENIQKLVRTFYPTILSDEIVGPFFIEKIGADIKSKKWQIHLELLSNFWASMALGDTDYQGNPLAVHFDMPGISREAFERWLELFHQAVDKVYNSKSGDFFKERSTHIAGNFMRNLGL